MQMVKLLIKLSTVKLNFSREIATKLARTFEIFALDFYLHVTIKIFMIFNDVIELQHTEYTTKFIERERETYNKMLFHLPKWQNEYNLRTIKKKKILVKHSYVEKYCKFLIAVIVTSSSFFHHLSSIFFRENWLIFHSLL